MRILISLAICLAAIPAALAGAGPAETVPTDRFTISLETPPVSYERDGQGAARVVIDGFETRSAPEGAPDIPMRTLRIAIPDGAEPRLELSVADWRGLSGPRPRAVPRRVHRLDQLDRARLDASRGDLRTRLEILQRGAVDEEHPDPAYYSEGRSWPERVAWLGETGRLRDQRYVEVHLAPVRWDGATRRLAAATRVELTVRFDGAGPVASTPSALDPRFEDVYRQSLVNYEQGRLFRRTAGARRSIVATSRAASGGPAPFKIFVEQDGFVRLDHATLAAAGVLAAGADPTQWRLSNQGVTIPLQLRQTVGDDALLEPGEWVQFYGQRLDHEPKTRLNTDRPDTDLDLFEAADFSDVNVYWLEVATGAPQPTIAEHDAAPICGGCAVPGWFDETLHVEVDESYFPLGGADPWYWSILSSTFPPADTTVPLELTGLVSGSDPAAVRVRMRGLSPYSSNVDQLHDPDHLTRVTLKDDVGSVLFVDDESWDGRIVFDHAFPYAGAGGDLTESAMLQLEALVVPSTGNDIALDWVEVDYRRSFTAVDDRLEFAWPDGDVEFEIGGLSTSVNLEVYELSTPTPDGVEVATRLHNLSVTPGPAPYTVRFRIDDVDPGGSPLRRFVIGAGSFPPPAPGSIVQSTPSNLRDQANQADLIVIAHPDVLDMGAGPCIAPAPTGCLPELLSWRATAAGGGLTSTVASIEQVEDEFNDGLSGPDAIREFLRWVMSDAPGEGWADPKPSYVMLLGDGSYAYKSGTSAGNFVSTQMMFRDRYELGYYASDNRMAAVVGDDELADLVVGRIPARSAADANVMLEKILSYEQSPPVGPWQSHMLLMADRGHTGTEGFEATAFELINQRGLDSIDQPPFDTTHLKYYPDYYLQMAPIDARMAMHDAIVAEVNGDPILRTGAALVQFAGHGNFWIWSDDSYWDERDDPLVADELEFDTFELTNGKRLPWMMAHNCLTGGFHILPSNSLGENWLRREGGGGVAVFAPSGLSFDFLGLRASEVVWKSLFGPAKSRDIGSTVLAAVAAMCGQGSIEPCQHYVLLGDPATHLQIRSTAPPTDVTTTSGNTTVTLDWTASATPGATYDVYRFSSLINRLYIKANVAPINGTTFVDTGLVNAKTWYYHVVAVDPDGFESRWSHFNSDCGVSGPDCLSETPLNPNPPDAPANVGLIDQGIGTTLQVVWDPPSEDDLAGYTLHYGTESGVYTQSLDVGVGTNALLSGLTPGQMYFVAVTATNTSQLTSALSNEVAESPLEAFGFRAPAFIDTLSVTADGADALLQWAEVATDAYGKPVTVGQYEILRGTAPDYSNAGLVSLATCNAPCAEYRDVGALASGASYSYRVRAIDVAGFESGLGSEFPRWTGLRLSRSVITPGDVRLEWDPVTTTIAGGPTQVLRYRVYGSDQPFTRLDVRNGLVDPPLLETGTALEVTPDPGVMFFSVLVEDVRGNMSPF